MYEVTMQDLTVFIALGFCCGLFASIFVARFLEVVHTWRMVQDTITHLLWMCSKIVEDVAFLQEVKRSHMRKAEFTTEQIRQFDQVLDKLEGLSYTRVS